MWVRWWAQNKSLQVNVATVAQRRKRRREKCVLLATKVDNTGKSFDKVATETTQEHSKEQKVEQFPGHGGYLVCVVVGGRWSI
jgi:hypothetical protein